MFSAKVNNLLQKTQDAMFKFFTYVCLLDRITLMIHDMICKKS